MQVENKKTMLINKFFFGITANEKYIYILGGYDESSR